MAKICINITCICFTLLVLPSSTNSRYLLVELDVSTDMDPGMDDTSVGTKMPEPKEEPIDDLEPSPEDDEEVAVPEAEERAITKIPLNRNTPPRGFRSSN